MAISFLREDLKPVDRLQLGWTEEEYNNFLIDVFTQLKEDYPETKIMIEEGKDIQITLYNEWFDK